MLELVHIGYNCRLSQMGHPVTVPSLDVDWGGGGGGSPGNGHSAGGQGRVQGSATVPSLLLPFRAGILLHLLRQQYKVVPVPDPVGAVADDGPGLTAGVSGVGQLARSGSCTVSSLLTVLAPRRHCLDEVGDGDEDGDA